MEQKTDINRRVVGKMYRRVMNRSMKLQLPLIDSRCYEYKSTPHARAVTNEEIERIVEYVMSTSENRKKSALVLIQEMDLKGLKHDRYERQLPLSESCFKQIMYDSGYGRGIAGWKTDLDDIHKQNRLDFARKYRTFD